MAKSETSAQLQELIEARAAAIRAKDVARALSVYTPDVVNFDLPPPLRFIGAEALDPKGLGGWFETWVGPIGLEHRDFQVFADGELAFAHGLVRLHGKRTGGETTDVWVRQTFGFHRVAGAWKIAHEHTSVPFYMDGSYRAAVDLKP
ncbi:MAG TPA: nuclear transport factor 2 family protein [Alphaproteobacteria bacterium]|nr:nuclear transport factor 2 family protein [Alphaproteobacteria bacterium]